MHVAINAWFWNQPTTGSGQYVRRLVERLVPMVPDLRITLVALEGRISAPHCSWLNVRFQPVPIRLPLSSRLLKVWFEQVGFPHICRRLGVDLAHVPYWAPPAHSPVPSVVTIHDLIPLLLRPYRGGALVRLYTGLVCATARDAALVLTDSAASRRDIVDRLGLARERVRVVPLAAGERFRPDPAPDDLATRAGYGLPARYALYLGGFDVRKNLATVLATYRWAGSAIGDECPLVVAGRLPAHDTPFTPDPRRLARELDVDESHVHFTGYVEEEDKPAIYRGAVAFLFPSVYEGFGLPPLEALACSVPVVGSDTASLPEIVGDAGVLLPPGDAEGMAGALIQLATDPAFRAELSRRALVQAARFSWERTAQETWAAYRRVLEQKPPGEGVICQQSDDGPGDEERPVGNMIA